MLQSQPKRQISVFIASPGDLIEERKQFRKTIEILNIGFGDGAHVEFKALGWEDIMATTGYRAQDVIHQAIDCCDVFILAMGRRWGQKAPDAKPYDSYTEEEFHRALARWKKTKKPTIFVFFKHVDAASEADPGDQLEKVLTFRKQLEDSRIVLYGKFLQAEAFGKEVDKHLRAFAKDELPNPGRPREAVILPSEMIQKVEKAESEAAKQKERATAAKQNEEAAKLKIKEMQFQMAKDAAQFALDGYLEHAREKFVSLIGETSNLQILALAETFFTRTGDFDSSTEILERWLEIAEPESEDAANAQNRLGKLYRIRGNLEQALAICEKALATNSALGCKSRMGQNLGNLGIIFEIRGDLEQAVAMFQRASDIAEMLGEKEDLAIQYGNLANIYRIRGDLELAETTYKKTIGIWVSPDLLDI